MVNRSGEYWHQNSQDGGDGNGAVLQGRRTAAMGCDGEGRLQGTAPSNFGCQAPLHILVSLWLRAPGGRLLDAL